MRSVIAFVALCVGLFATLSVAQDAQIQIDRGPHYVGDPIAVQVVASQFESDPAPDVKAGVIDGAILRFAGASDSSSTSISIANGRITRTKEVRFIYSYELVARTPGQIRIPPFVVQQGTTSRTTRPTQLTIQGVPTTGLVSIEVEVPVSHIDELGNLKCEHPNL